VAKDLQEMYKRCAGWSECAGWGWGCMGMGGEGGGGADQREDGDVAEDEQCKEAYVVVHELVEGGRTLPARDELPPGWGLGLGLWWGLGLGLWLGLGLGLRFGRTQ
jgi:hypothetical protein